MNVQNSAGFFTNLEQQELVRKNKRNKMHKQNVSKFFTLGPIPHSNIQSTWSFLKTLFFSMKFRSNSADINVMR